MGMAHPPESESLTLVLPSISKFGYSFRPESVVGGVWYCGFALRRDIWA